MMFRLIRKKLIDAFLFINLNVSLSTVELSELLQYVCRLLIIPNQCGHIAATPHLSHLLQILQKEHLRLRHLLLQLITQLYLSSIKLYVARSGERKGLVDGAVHQQVLGVSAHCARELEPTGGWPPVEGGSGGAEVDQGFHDGGECVIGDLLDGLR